MKRYGGQRHPKIEPFEILKQRGDILQWRYVPPKSTVIYVSHEWVGTDHPDPDGTQMYHLLRVFEPRIRTELRCIIFFESLNDSEAARSLKRIWIGPTH